MTLPLSVSGIAIGHATDLRLKSGVTVILPDAPAVAAVHVAGGAPATRETDLLRPGNLVERVDAVVLSGGSAFGLAAADGVMSWLAAEGRGFEVAGMRVPIVPAASLFDLANGGDKQTIPAEGNGHGSTYFAFGQTACSAAAVDFKLGSVGAGTGATTADLKGGFGAAAAELSGGARIAAYVAANALGRATLGGTPFFRAGAFEQNAEFGGLGMPREIPPGAADIVTKGPRIPGANTTIAVIATDLALTRNELHRVAIAAHDGLAMSIFPAHTVLDGDAVFALSTGRIAVSDRLHSLVETSAAAEIVLARAVSRAIYEAAPAPGDRVPTWRQRYEEWRSRL